MENRVDSSSSPDANLERNPWLSGDGNKIMVNRDVQLRQGTFHDRLKPFEDRRLPHPSLVADVPLRER